MRIPSTTNGDLTRKSVAPISFMIAISSRLTAIPVVTVVAYKENRNTQKNQNDTSRYIADKLI